MLSIIVKRHITVHRVLQMVIILETSTIYSQTELAWQVPLEKRQIIGEIDKTSLITKMIENNNLSNKIKLVGRRTMGYQWIGFMST